MYKTVVCGGTFDHFHKGHKAFLRFAFAQGKHVLIGVTSDTFAHQKGEEIELLSRRMSAVRQFLKDEKLLGRFTLMSIHSPNIPDEWNTENVEAIIATPATKGGARQINLQRKKNKRQPLQILTCDFVMADDKKPLSSTRIRRGEVDRDGKLYVQDAWRKKTLILPDSLRATLQKPFGELVSIENISLSPYKKKHLITVGDVITSFFLKHRITPALSVVDFHVQRKRVYTMLSQLGFRGHERVYTVTNPPGEIRPEVFTLCHALFSQEREKTPIIVRIIGEEDLIVLPLLLAAPLGFLIVYGQPNEGFVNILVTEENKKRAYKITTRFLTSEE